MGTGQHTRRRHSAFGTGAGGATTRETHGMGYSVIPSDPFFSDQIDAEPIIMPDIPAGIIDGSSHILPSSIPVSAFEAQIRAPTAVDVLPPLPDAAYPLGSLVLFLGDFKLYRNDNDQWTRSVDAQDITVGQLTADQIAAGSIGAVHIVTEGITADVIRGGVLVLRPVDEYTQGIRVEDEDGDLLSSWGPTGMKITDPADPTRYVLINAGAVAFTTNDGADGFPNAITPDGINATSLRFGAAPGGHNLVMNSSFELAAFVALPSTFVFTDTTNWAAGNRVTALDNITEGTSLTITTAGFV